MIDTRGGMISMNKPNKGFIEEDVVQLRSELSTAIGYIVHTDNTVASLNNKINEMREEKNTAYNFAQTAQANALAALDQAEIEEAKLIADEAVEQIIKAIVNAGSESLDDTI